MTDLKGLIQIAGIGNREEALMLIAAGVRQLGFPLRLDVHREDLTEEETAAIIRSLPSSASAVLITYLSQADELITLCRKTGCRKIQLHGKISLSQLKKLRALDQDLLIIKSLIVRNQNLAELKTLMQSYTPDVDAFITDTFDPETGASGATGKAHDWEVSRKLVKMSARPVILAGGLNPANVRQAIFTVKPAGVDTHSGVERPDGKKDKELVETFVREATDAFASLGEAKQA
ncbi:MAG: phosphoribosylanthranilate isomerase [Deltaproteobacteria bacterium]|nr:phosphoribosylanthranilate isomerase [Deltaproteobacteria bacterium]